jgi:hypothetical protein
MKAICNKVLVGIAAWLVMCSAYAQQYQVPALSKPDSWTMILIPDPQTYIKFDYNRPLFDLMTAWIAKNREPLNIGLVLCTGDLVEQNNILNPDGKNGNQSSKSQWEAVSHSFNCLNEIVPYILATGNHDYGFKSAENRQTFFDDYFPVDKNRLNKQILHDTGTGINGMPTLANATFEYVSPQGKKFLILTLEFAPRNETLEWAKKLVAQKKYAEHIVILLTHSYLNCRSERIVSEAYPVQDANYGEAIWEKLVEPSSNIQLVLSGHIGAPNDFRQHVGFRQDTNAAGKIVNQMVFNAQALGGGWHGNGGDGWLRILEFLPDSKTVNVKTFSTLFSSSPTTQQFAWERSDYNEFTFIFD